MASGGRLIPVTAVACTVADKKSLIGIIGDKRHAKRLREIVESSHEAEVGFIFNPRSLPDHPLGTTNLHDLRGSDAIIIATPNQYHFEYLVKVTKWGKYVFLEKPIAHNEDDFLNSIEIIRQGKVYVNYNYRYSLLDEKLREYKEEIGKIINVEVVSNNGLAFNDEAKKDWRLSDREQTDTVLRTKAIHWIDYLSYLFGEPQNMSYRRKSFGPRDQVDTAFISMNWQEGPSASVLTSYAAPLNFMVTVYGTNGTITFRKSSATLISPRDCFDERGLFTEPPEVLLDYPKGRSLYTDSLAKSFQRFLSIVQGGSLVPENMIDQSILTETLLNQFIKEYSLKRG